MTPREKMLRDLIGEMAREAKSVDAMLGSYHAKIAELEGQLARRDSEFATQKAINENLDARLERIEKGLVLGNKTTVKERRILDRVRE